MSTLANNSMAAAGRCCQSTIIESPNKQLEQTPGIINYKMGVLG